MSKKANMGTVFIGGDIEVRSYPSRSEKREYQLINAAENGKLSLEGVILYPSEIRKLKKDGFCIFDIKSYGTEKSSLYVATIDWASVYLGNIPHKVFSYIRRQIDELPKEDIHTFAQELFVIAHRNLKD